MRSRWRATPTSSLDDAVTINGGGGSNSLQGPDTTNDWQVTGLDAGTLNGITHFTSVQNLIGGSGPDTFCSRTGAFPARSTAASARSLHGHPGRSAGTGHDRRQWPEQRRRQLTVQGAPGDNTIVKTANQITWGSPVLETIHYVGIENVTIAAARQTTRSSTRAARTRRSSADRSRTPS